MGGFSVAATMLGEPDVGYLTQTEMADAARRVCRLTTRRCWSTPTPATATRSTCCAPSSSTTPPAPPDSSSRTRSGRSAAGTCRASRWSSAANGSPSCARCCRGATSSISSSSRAPTRAPRSVSRRRSPAARRRAISAPTPSSSRRRNRSRSSSASPAPSQAQRWRTWSKAAARRCSAPTSCTSSASISSSRRSPRCSPRRAPSRDVYAELRRSGSLRGRLDELLTFDEFNALIGLERHSALERQFRTEPESPPQTKTEKRR